MNTTLDKGWSPYLAGSLSGLLIIMTVWISDKYFGSSTSFVRTAGMIENLVASERVGSMEYFIKFVPEIDWQWMFVAGIMAGSFVSAVTSGSFRLNPLPEMWKARFGRSRIKRLAVAFLGGFIAIFGARIAGGCPSGHGLSGTLQLAVSGFIALACFYAGGMLTARAIYGRGNKK